MPDSHVKKPIFSFVGHLFLLFFLFLFHFSHTFTFPPLHTTNPFPPKTHSPRHPPFSSSCTPALSIPTSTSITNQEEMTTAEKPRSVAIVGAGPVGALMAVYLANRGWNVHVYETRPGTINICHVVQDMRKGVALNFFFSFLLRTRACYYLSRRRVVC